MGDVVSLGSVDLPYGKRLASVQVADGFQTSGSFQLNLNTNGPFLTNVRERR
jgi:hypothetical protein